MNRRIWVFIIAVLVVRLSADTMAQVEYIDPAGGFTQVVTTTDRGVKTIFVSGQVGQGENFQEHVQF